MNMKRLAILVIVLASALQMNAGARTLFRNGKTSYTIVIAPEASEAERFAAGELQRWICEVSGVEIPVGNLQDGRPGKRLVVGFNDLTKEILSGVEAASEPGDAFTYCSKGGDILLWGDSDRGTLYSVYAFLEYELGCRWYSSKVSVAPAARRWGFRRLNVHEEPAIRVRNDFWFDAFDPLWAVRNRSNGTLGTATDPRLGGNESIWGGHTFNEFCPPSVYFKSHPEYFSEINGKRTCEYAQLCLSNPDVLQLCIDWVREVIRRHPDHLIYSVAQNDNYDACQCEKCRAIKEQYGNQESGIMLWFVNQVADAIKDEFPDKFLCTFAYQYTRTAPENIRPRDNVVIRLCSIEECQVHDMDECESNKAFLHDLEAWSAIAPHLFIWDYVATFTQYLSPMPNIQTFQSRMKAFRDNNAIGVMPQGNYQSIGGAFDELRAYVLARLLWNPDCDVDAVVDDFLNGFFGAAGPVLKDYLDYEREALVRDDVHETCFPNAQSPIYNDEFIVRGREMFAKAKELVADDPELLARVERAELPLCYLQIARTPRVGYESGALDLFKKVCDRDGITLTSEWGGYGSVNAFLGQMHIARYMNIDPAEYGDCKLKAPDRYFRFKKISVNSDAAADDPVAAKLVDAILMSSSFPGYNGKTGMYFYISPEVGGKEESSFIVSGKVQPDVEYEAVCPGGWRDGEIVMSGFDPKSDYVIVVTSADGERLTYKFIKL